MYGRNLYFALVLQVTHGLLQLTGPEDMLACRSDTTKLRPDDTDEFSQVAERAAA